MSIIQIADKPTLDSVKTTVEGTSTDVTTLKARGGIKYNATSSKPQVYDVANAEWVDFEVGGGGGASPTLVVVNDSGTMTGKDVTVESQDGLFTQTKVMTSANYEVYELPWLGTYYIKWELNGVMHSQTAVVDKVGGVVSTACIPRLTVINKNRSYDNRDFTVTSSDGTESYTITMPADTSINVELKDLGTYNIIYQGDLLDTPTTITTIISTVSGSSVELERIASYPSFANATNAGIATMVALHYQDEIDLSTIWSVGDTRKLSLSSFAAPNPNSDNTWVAQDIIITILDFNHTDLATPINGHTKAALTLQTREVLSGTSNTSAGSIYVDGSASYDMFTKWSNLYMRTYLNNQVFNAFPSEIKSSIKPSKHYRHTTFNGTASEQVTDNLFLPSYPEIFGTNANSSYAPTSPVEGTQFKYYEITTNRIKYNNNNGTKGSSSHNWWNSSPSSSYHSDFYYSWGIVHTSGGASFVFGTSSFALAPAFAM